MARALSHTNTLVDFLSFSPSRDDSLALLLKRL